jgi:hypothetical protein
VGIMTLTRGSMRPDYNIARRAALSASSLL